MSGTIGAAARSAVSSLSTDSVGELQAALGRLTDAIEKGVESELHSAANAVAARIGSMPSPPERAMLLLAVAHLDLFDARGRADELASSVEYTRRAIRQLRADAPDRAEILASAAAALFDVHVRTDDAELLDETVRVARSAAAAGERDTLLLATALRTRFEIGGRAEDLIAAERAASAALAEPDEPRAERYAELAHILRLRHDRTGARDDAERAASAAERSVALAAADSEFLREYLARWAGALLDCHHAGHRRALAAAVAVARVAVDPRTDAATPGFDAIHTAIMVLGEHAACHTDAAAAREARSLAVGAIAAAGEAWEYAVAQDALSTAAYTAYPLLGDPALLDEAVDAGRAACAVAEVAAADRAGHCGNLGATLYDRYAARGALDDLKDAIEWDRRAIDLLTDSHPDRARYLSNLGIALRARFEAFGDLADLSAAVEAGRASVDRTPDGPMRALRLANLATILSARYERLGDLTELDEAVELGRAALRALPETSPDLPGLSANIATALRMRYERLGTRDDLIEAGEWARRAVAAEPRPGDLPDILDTCALVAAALALDDPSLTAQAIDLGMRAVRATGPEDPRLPGRLGNLISMLSDSGESGASLTPVIARIEESLAAMPADHPERAALLGNLALARHHLDPEDSRSRETVARALREMDPTHPDRAQLLINMAYLATARPAPTASERSEAIEALRTASRHPSAPPAVRWRAALGWGRLAEENRDIPDAAAALVLAIELLQLISPFRLARADMHRVLGTASGLASRAAALLLILGREAEAVAVLESGRGVLVNRTLRVRRWSRAVRHELPTLVARFEQLQRALDRDDVVNTRAAVEPRFGLGSGPVAVGERPRAADGHARVRAANEREFRRRCAEELDEVVSSVRARGFPDFLRPLPLDALLAPLGDRYVVIVNVSEHRCDALVLGGDGVRVVPLPAMTSAEVDRRAREFHETLAVIAEADSIAVHRAAEARLTETMHWLWDTLAAPVVTELDGREPGHPIRRVSWMLTGALVFLPVHAAVARDGGDSLLDRVVSSYTPTVEALQTADPASVAAASNFSVVVSTAVGGVPLPAATAEARAVALRHDIEPIDCASCADDEIEHALTGSRRVHVALHAVADVDDPARSGFLLPDRVLTVAELAARENMSADFAYLSACETTLTTATLADEAVHLTNAFQLMGFRAVLGTLWAVGDRIAAAAARSFYRELDRTSGDAALAMHHTVRWLRGRYHDFPSAWAAFHHAGE